MPVRSPGGVAGQGHPGNPGCLHSVEGKVMVRIRSASKLLVLLGVFVSAAIFAYGIVGCTSSREASSRASDVPEAARAGSASADLLANGGFERGAGSPDGWTAVSRDVNDERTAPPMSWDGAVARTGSRSVRIARSDADGVAKWAEWTAEIAPVKPNGWYELSGWVKMADVKGGGIALALDDMTSVPRSGTSGWTRVRVVTQAHADQTSLKVQAQGWAFTGKAWFDDLALVELPGEPRGFPGTRAKRGDEIVSVWVHCASAWGIRPVDPDGSRNLTVKAFHKDMAEFFAWMEALGVTHLYGLPPNSKDHYKEQWGIDLPGNVLYLKEAERRGMRVFLPLAGWAEPDGGAGDIYAARRADGTGLPGSCWTHPEIAANSLKVKIRPLIEKIRSYRARGLKIAGIYTDFIRWKVGTPCACPLCRKEYAKVKDRMTMNDFRCEPITKYLRSVRAELDKVDEKLMIVGAVKAGNPRAWGQDTPRWLREGIYDYVMPMAYGGTMHWAWNIDYLVNEHGVDPRKIVMLTALYYGSTESKMSEIALAKDRGIGGVSFFGWRKRYYKTPYRKANALRTKKFSQAINPAARQ